MTSLAFNLFVLGVEMWLEHDRSGARTTEDLENWFQELFESGANLRRYLNHATNEQRAAYLDALERLMAAARDQIKSERGRG